MSLFRLGLMPMLALSAMASAQPPKAATGLAGTWRNASDSVRVRIAKCGPAMCGTVVQASEKAKADAARGGTDRLVGTRLFDGFERGDDGLWYGSVYVPDIDREFDGTIEQVDANTLVGEGCLLGRLGCKTQTWKRVR